MEVQNTHKEGFLLTEWHIVQQNGNPHFLAHTHFVHLPSKKGVQAVTDDSQFKQDAKQLARSPSLSVCACVCVLLCASREWGWWHVCSFSSLFHLLFIFAVARSRSHVPLGACQVSGNQSEWLILLAHIHIPKHTHASIHCYLPWYFF